MRTTNRRTGRLFCFAASIVLLVLAVVVLTDAADSASMDASRRGALAQVLALGSIALMIGALMWTLAGRERVTNASAHAMQPPAAYPGGPVQYPQPGWQSPAQGSHLGNSPGG